MLELGVKAPEFKLQDKDGNLVSLSDFKNKKVVLYFYPRDNTPGCTKQACSFRDNYEEFKSKNVFDHIVVNKAQAKVSILGNVSHFVQELGKYTILDLDTENSSLEDVFMQYYGNSDNKQAVIK